MQDRSRRHLSLAALGTLVISGAAVVGLAQPALADPSGGPLLTATCNQYTGTPDGGTWNDQFDGLIGHYDAGYRVTITYTDANGPESSYDEGYWFPDPDTGAYDHTYDGSRSVPIAGTAYFWSLTEYAGGVEYDDILTGSGIVGGPACHPKPQKPNQPDVMTTTIKVSKKGTFDVSIGGDSKTTGSVSVTNRQGQLASGGYAIHSGDSADVKLKLGKADLKQLEKARSETVKFAVTATNAGGTVKSKTGGTLEGPALPKKKKK